MIYPDFLELLRAFARHKVEYVLIGGYAVGLYSEPRFTKDLDLLIKPSKENAQAVLSALEEFGAPIANLTVSDLAKPGLLYVFGISPLRVDILNRIEGVSVAPLLKRAKRIRVGDTSINLVSFNDLIRLKKIAARPQDLADIEKLRQAANLNRSGNKKKRSLR